MTAWHSNLDIPAQEIVGQSRALGVAPGDVVLVHTSFRAVRPVAGGSAGYAPSKLMRARDVIDTVVPKLKNDPFTFLHRRGSACVECADAWRSVPA